MSAKKRAGSGESKRKTRGDTATRTVRLVNKTGLHLRPAALFVKTANRFPNCRVTLGNGVERVNGKSIMGVVTLAAPCGTELTIEIVGDRAREAMDALCQLIANKFDGE